MHVQPCMCKCMSQCIIYVDRCNCKLFKQFKQFVVNVRDLCVLCPAVCGEEFGIFTNIWDEGSEEKSVVQDIIVMLG